MRKIFVSTFLLSFLFLGTSSKPEQFDPCKVFGVIYVEDNPRYAHFKVFEEESEAFADVIVYEEDSKLYADGGGRWFFTEVREFADFYIYFEEERGLADFSIFYTDFESFSGCNN